MSCETCDDNLLIDPVVLNEGADGLDGNFGGFSGDWIYESNTGFPPSTLKIRLNNSSLASVTELYINKTNASNIDYTNFLASFVTSGLLRISKEFSSSVFWMGKIVSTTDSGAYYTIVVNTILSNGSFTNNGRLVVSYVTPASTSTSNIIVNDNTTILNGLSVFTEMYSTSIPANSLAIDGDELVCKYVVGLMGAGSGISYVRVQINNGDISPTLTKYELSKSHPRLFIEISIVRNSNTTACIILKTFAEDQYHNLEAQYGTHTVIAGFVFNTNPILIDVDSMTSGYAGEYVNLEAESIYQYNQ